MHHYTTALLHYYTTTLLHYTLLHYTLHNTILQYNITIQCSTALTQVYWVWALSYTVLYCITLYVTLL
jgi:hypothetical protein